jgi:preprotein translocase subunit SecE
MENDNKKLLTVSFFLCGALVAVVANMLMETFAATWGVVGRIVSHDIVNHGLPVFLGVLTFVLLQFNKSVVAFTEEVVQEVKKVVWPSRKDTTAMTIVVCIMLMISGAILGLFDMVSGYLLNFLVN